jgi:hypothetical protein
VPAGPSKYLEIIEDIDREDRNRCYKDNPFHVATGEKLGEMQDQNYDPQKINNY